jgi:hypothetical protein
MKPRHLLKELERVAAAVSVTVRTQPFRGSSVSPGGLCKVRGQSVVLLNSRSHEDERALVLGEVLAKMNTSGVNMSEEVREFLLTRGSPRIHTRAAARSLRGPGLKQARPKREPEAH